MGEFLIVPLHHRSIAVQMKVYTKNIETAHNHQKNENDGDNNNNGSGSVTNL